MGRSARHKRIRHNARLLQSLCEQIAVELHRLYPLYDWTAMGSADGSMVTIGNPHILAETGVGYSVKTELAQQTTGRTELLRKAASEYLERYDLPKEAKDAQASFLLDARGRPLLKHTSDLVI